ncbi:hypothetical protein FSP39_022777 [Pinctada imbricata]|uniref:Mab-21-like HhH/H2TH-like domain-containing protein n=1 Tax=Pinctada imbricata TaxID=66713 RepID=A0AA89C9A2_PINIB|nr:hypothetical protein FSP39_022777 [Pinctada imbricata]
MENRRRALFEMIYEKECVMQETIEDLHDIEENVRKILRQLLDKLQKEDPSFRVKEIVPTGSFYEGTKVRVPDEFDYMIVLDPCAFSTSLKLGSGCESSPWFKHIELEGSKSARGFLLYDNHVRKPVVVEGDFWKRVGQIVRSCPITLQTRYGKIVTKEVTDHKLFLDYSQENRRQNTVQEYHGRHLALISINRKEIGVDMMLAFEHPQPESVLAHTYFPKAYREMLSGFGCHLVTKSCHSTIKENEGTTYLSYRCRCWFISFAKMETEMMRRLDNIHKKCFKILKALLIGDASYPGKCMNLSSYVLKTAVLFHVFGENPCLETLRFESCISQILQYLKKGFENINMPCFFARDMNVWGRVVVAPVLENDYGYGIDVPTVYSMLWVEFWRRVMMVVEDLLDDKPDSKAQNWPALLDELAHFRALVSFLLQEYFRSKQDKSRGVIGPGAGSIHPFNHIPPKIASIFPQYIEDWKKIVTSRKFDLKRLVDIADQGQEKTLYKRKP